MSNEDRSSARYLRIVRSLAQLAGERPVVRVASIAALVVPVASMLAGCPGPLPPPEVPAG